jgi:hypothetical protein
VYNSISALTVKSAFELINNFFCKLFVEEIDFTNIRRKETFAKNGFANILTKVRNIYPFPSSKAQNVTFQLITCKNILSVISGHLLT